MLDVRRMRVLREVAARGSFSAAADALAYTQSAVSQQIAALEREAGTTLVERNARGVRLTDAGRALVEHADAILARLSDAEAELEAIAGLRGGRLRLAAFPSAGASIMPEAIARFRERHPAVELTLEPAEPEAGPAAPARRRGRHRARHHASPSGRWPTTASCACTCSTTRCTSRCPSAIRWRASAGCKLEELADENWILGTTGSCPDASIFLRSCQVAGFEPRIAFNSDDYFAMQGFVAAGVGASFIPDLALMSVRDDIVVRSLGPRPPVRQIMAGTLKDSFLSPAKQAMLDVLVEVGEEFAGKHRGLALAS